MLPPLLDFDLQNGDAFIQAESPRPGTHTQRRRSPPPHRELPPPLQRGTASRRHKSRCTDFALRLLCPSQDALMNMERHWIDLEPLLLVVAVHSSHCSRFLKASAPKKAPPSSTTVGHMPLARVTQSLQLAGSARNIGGKDCKQIPTSALITSLPPKPRPLRPWQHEI
jgi:hypothetical protein